MVGKVKLLQFYTFPRVKGTLDLSGIWETTAAKGLNGPSVQWEITRRMTWSAESPLDVVNQIPERIILDYAFHVERKNIFGP